MSLELPSLQGHHIRLEPLDQRHIAGLAGIAAGETDLYRWTQVPSGEDEARRYVATALAMRDSGKAVPFATVRQADGAVIGSTRFFDLEWWAWPAGHERHGHPGPDGGEIGYTWLAPAAVRSGANTEAKLLMLAHAFEHWGMLRVCLHTDARNTRSRAAMERIGCRFEGILRGHRMAADFIARDSARYSIVAAEWPQVKARLAGLLRP